jgi:hypothetical protein
MKKLLLCLSLTTTLGLSSCADRPKVNCERQRNKALTVQTTNQIGGGRCA